MTKPSCPRVDQQMNFRTARSLGRPPRPAPRARRDRHATGKAGTAMISSSPRRRAHRFPSFGPAGQREGAVEIFPGSGVDLVPSIRGAHGVACMSPLPVALTRPDGFPPNCRVRAAREDLGRDTRARTCGRAPHASVGWVGITRRPTATDSTPHSTSHRPPPPRPPRGASATARSAAGVATRPRGVRPAADWR